MMNYGYTPYMNPMATPQQRLAQMEQQFPQFATPQPVMQPQMPTVRATLVMSKEEAVAQQVPMDGTLSVFVAGNEIYTKKLGNDGLPEFKTFKEMVSNVSKEKLKSLDIPKNTDIEELKAQIKDLQQQIEELKNAKQSDADVSNVRTTKKQS